MTQPLFAQINLPSLLVFAIFGLSDDGSYAFKRASSSRLKSTAVFILAYSFCKPVAAFVTVFDLQNSTVSAVVEWGPTQQPSIFSNSVQS